MRTIGLFSLLVILGLSACERSKAAPAQTVTSPPVSAAQTQPEAKITKIVFVDKEKACDCTRKRVEGAWTTLQTALGTPPALPVQRLHVDTQAAEVAPYTSAKPLMVPPGIYFVDGRGTVVDLLQGEIEAKEIETVLKRR